MYNECIMPTECETGKIKKQMFNNKTNLELHKNQYKQ